MLLLSELPPNVIIEIELQMAQKITNKSKKKRGRRIERKRVLWRSKLKSKGVIEVDRERESFQNICN